MFCRVSPIVDRLPAWCKLSKGDSHSSGIEAGRSATARSIALAIKPNWCCWFSWLADDHYQIGTCHSAQESVCISWLFLLASLSFSAVLCVVCLMCVSWKINTAKLRKINKCQRSTRSLSHLTIITLIWDMLTNLLCPHLSRHWLRQRQPETGDWGLKTGENVAQRIDCQQVWPAGGKRRILVLCAVVWDDVVINGGVAVLRVVLN